jgi:hypothetical protein
MSGEGVDRIDLLWDRDRWQVGSCEHTNSALGPMKCGDCFV